MRWSMALGLALGAALLSGCSVVVSPEPVGTAPHAIVAEEWDGTWIGEGGAVTFQTKAPEKGLLAIGWLEDEPEGLVMETSEVHLREQGTWILASMKTSDPDEPLQYAWGRLLKDDDRIVFWLADPDKFETLVEAGMLPGKIDGSTVVLGKLEPSHLALIASEAEGVLFAWEEPMIMTRVKS